MAFEAGYCTSLPFQAKTFDFLFDNGTLDCIVSAPTSRKKADKAIAEMSRMVFISLLLMDFQNLVHVFVFQNQKV
jgi:hypothetical protein